MNLPWMRGGGVIRYNEKRRVGTKNSPTSVHPANTTETFPPPGLPRLRGPITSRSSIDTNASTRHTRHTYTPTHAVEHAAQKIEHASGRRRDDAIDNMSVDPSQLVKTGW